MAAGCYECDWRTPEVVRHIAGCQATWHVYEEHPVTWALTAGDRPPADPDARIPEIYMALSFAHGMGACLVG